MSVPGIARQDFKTCTQYMPRWQDLQDAFAWHAQTPIRVQKARQDAKTSKAPSHGMHRFQDALVAKTNTMQCRKNVYLYLN